MDDTTEQAAIECDFSVQQCYRITITAPISERFQSMYKAILSDQKALRAVLTFRILAEQDDRNGGHGLYQSAYYHDKNMDFATILLEHCPLVQPDRAWLIGLIAQNINIPFNIVQQLEELENCFQVTATCWDVMPYYTGHSLRGAFVV